MEITFKLEHEIKKFNGYLEQNNNKYYAKIEIPDSESIPDIIENIKCFHEKSGIMTLMNNHKISVSEHRDNPGVAIYTYESDYVIQGSVDRENLLIKTMSVYYKESDYFFVKDKHKYNYKKNHQFQIIQNRVIKTLLENDEIIITYVRHGGIKKNDSGEKIFINPAWINITFKENIKINDFFVHLRKIECVLGFVFNRKMNLIDLTILTMDDHIYTIIPPFKKDFSDIIISGTPVVDLTSIKLLKDILKKYYSDEHIASSINMYYEYLYSDLDNIFEFTSLVNTIELIMSSTFYINKVKKYTLRSNKVLKDNNKRMNKILKQLSHDDQKFIKGFYNEKHVELRDKIKFIFEDVFELIVGQNEEKYVSSIINTRNYYVHGTQYKNMLNSVNLVLTKKIMRNMLYLLIIRACSKQTNYLIEVYNEIIPIVYKSIIKSY